MSLIDQSQQWFPTSVQVTVHQARNLRIKGKNGTNDAYAIIQVAKDKFSTSVAEKCVAPVWKEEAAFDLPLFHPGNAERCTLYIIVMHRAQMGLDKFLGQAVINLLDLYDNKSRKKTEWFKLVDKTGKEDKVRGEVLLDMQFMRNNMSASMFDLSMQDKPRSRISKLKDKVRGKKRDGFSDSASAIVPSVSQVLTDSEGEADAQSLNQSPGAKKKSKLKTLFAPKTNLQRNISQSMSTLGTLPEKNSSLGGSRSSGLNVDSPEVKKKFKFLGHKRTGSSDSKLSLGGFSLLGKSKQSNSDLNNLCINGNHVYTEEAETKSGSTLSLNSSGQGSVEDVRKHTSNASADSTDKALLEQQHHQEEVKRKQAEEKRIAEAKRQEEEEKYRAEVKRLQEEEQHRQQEEQERKRRFLEDEARRKKQEEEERRKKEEELRMLEAAENQRLEEERKRVEEQKRQEEASMSDRLSSLFGMIRKKEDKKEEVQQPATEEQQPTPAPRSDSRGLDQPVPHSTNPFEDIPISPDRPVDDQNPPSRNPQTPSATVFLNRTAKVSAVKPRLAPILESEHTDSQPPSQLCPSPATSESALSCVPPESPDTFSHLHSFLAPSNKSQSLSGSPRGSTDNLSFLGSDGSSPTMADQKRRVLLPPLYAVQETKAGSSSVREIENPAYIDTAGSQQGKKLSLPLPDYETLFPQKRHGVQAHSRWDHIIAEVNQRHRDTPPELLGKEMSVDGPQELQPSPGSSISKDSPTIRNYQETKPVSSKKVAAPAPPKPVPSPHSRSVVDSSQNTAPHSLMRPNPSAVPASGKTDRGMSRDGETKALHPSPVTTPAPRTSSQMALDKTPSDDPRKMQVPLNKEAPTAKPRQKVKEPKQQEDSTMNGNVQPLSSSNVSSMDKKAKETFAEVPITERLPKDPWAQPKQNLFTSNVQKEQKLEDLGLTADDFDQIFNQEKTAEPFSYFSARDSNKQSDYRKKEDDSKQVGPAFQRKNSQRGRQILPSTARSDDKTFVSQQEAAFKEGTTVPTAIQGFSARDATDASVALQPQADGKTPNSLYAEEDSFRAQPLYVPSALASSESLQVVMEEPAPQTGGLPGGKAPLRAWVSPSEAQPVSTQNINGGGLALTPRRPHPVKPMSSAESPLAVKEIKARDSSPGKIKVVDPVASGPYSQLTQEELITLVVKQQVDLSRKDAKIVELEEYIDNLLVRVIEEKPAILYALNTAKPV
ncbi:uncharacterized protein rab11fip1a isoform X1 [Leuresthes tenuis]|uniref:uncharacterized protein rab11fip1a isoform X1 n=1 Tax=Leuresthes tenuis TaxID=355514 RepID=UPI003B50C5D7